MKKLISLLALLAFAVMLTQSVAASEEFGSESELQEVIDNWSGNEAGLSEALQYACENAYSTNTVFNWFSRQLPARYFNIYTAYSDFQPLIGSRGNMYPSREALMTCSVRIQPYWSRFPIYNYRAWTVRYNVDELYNPEIINFFQTNAGMFFPLLS